MGQGIQDWIKQNLGKTVTSNFLKAVFNKFHLRKQTQTAKVELSKLLLTNTFFCFPLQKHQGNIGSLTS